MAKRQATNRPRPSGRRMDDDALREKGFDPFLRPEHCREGEAFELTGFNAIDRSNPREQFKCQVRNAKGETFTLGIREGSPDHRAMHSALGSNYREWRGSVTVTIQSGSRDANVKFVNVKTASESLPDWSDVEPPAEQE